MKSLGFRVKGSRLQGFREFRVEGSRGLGVGWGSGIWVYSLGLRALGTKPRIIDPAMQVPSEGRACAARES